MPTKYRAEVPTKPGIYLLRHGGQVGVTLVELTEKGTVKSLGDSHHSNAQKLVTMTPVHYEFGPMVELSRVGDEEQIALVDW